MKRFIIFLGTLLLSFIAVRAQEVRPDYNNGYGLKNQRTGRWVVGPDRNIEDAGHLGSYKGTHYYYIKKNGAFAIVNEYGKFMSNFEFEGIGYLNDKNKVARIGCTTAKYRGSWGLISIEDLIVVIPFKYQYVSIGYTNFCVANDWNNKEHKYLDDDILSYIEKTRKELSEEKIRKANEEKEKAARAKKEKELASFTTYAKAFVEPRVNEWQKKGEYETTNEYSVRVTGPNRTAFVDSLQLVAENLFIKDHSDLHPEKENMSVGLYDADNQVFPIQSNKFGQLLLGVPRTEAPSFKENFSKVLRENPIFYIDGDKIALKSLTFSNPVNGKKYFYRNDDALEYKKVEIDPDTYEFNVVSISRNDVSVGTQTFAGIKKPTIKIISPESGTTYSVSAVTFQYETTTSNGGDPILHVWINGNEVSDLAPVQGVQSKGVKAAWKSITLSLPTDSTKPCSVMFSVIDDNGIPSENKVITLSYVGDIPKPTLYLFSVGVSDYPSSSLTKLNYAAKDAADFISVIQKSNLDIYGGLKTELIDNAKATRANIERGLSNLVKNVNQGDVVFLFFSGHGVRDGGNAFYMSYDADGNEPYTGVDFAMINRTLVKLKDKQCKVVMFMDACHSGMLYGGKGLKHEITFSEPGIIGFYSSTASQESAEAKSDENGIFTKAVLDGLKGGAKNKDGVITTMTLQSYVNERVKAASKGAQSPIVENNLGELTLFKVK